MATYPIPAFKDARGCYLTARLPIVRKALLVGIDYGHCGGQLSGPQKNVRAMASFLRNYHRIPNKDITVLCDDPSLPLDQQPTYANMIYHLERFVDEGVSGAQYIFLFCGHAEQKPEDADSRDEEDGKDEYIVPMDAMGDDDSIDDSRIIQDNVIRQWLVKPVPPGSQLLAIWDTCHSNTIMDLPHHRCNRVNTIRSSFHRSGRRALEIGSGLVGEEYANMIKEPVYNFKEELKAIMDDEYLRGRRICTGYCKRPRPDKAWEDQGRVLCVSACKDSQFLLEDPAGDALTTMIIKALKIKLNPSLKEFMRLLDDSVEDNRQRYQREEHDKMVQDPQLSSQIPLHMDEPLFLYQRLNRM